MTLRAVSIFNLLFYISMSAIKIFDTKTGEALPLEKLNKKKVREHISTLTNIQKTKLYQQANFLRKKLELIEGQLKDDFKQYAIRSDKWDEDGRIYIGEVPVTRGYRNKFSEDLLRNKGSEEENAIYDEWLNNIKPKYTVTNDSYKVS